MIDFLHLLARLDSVEPGYVRDWLVTFAAVFGVFWMIWNFVRSTKAPGPSSTVISPDPLQVKEVERLATRDEMEAMGSRLEHDIDELRSSLESERNVARTAIGKVHARIDQVATNTDEIRGVVAQIDKTTQLLLDRAIGKTQ